jgi:hypothetical protein|tara:strand:+ start:1699 stop:2046 length:348 start_codon:yes stop_codon:yes gene_type:complete
MDDFQENIKRWVIMDNEIKNMTDTLKNMKNQRSEISDTIMDYVETEKLNSTTININNGSLKFGTSRQNTSLTMTYVKSCLEKCIPEEDDVTAIMDVIKNSREVKISNEIKRSYRK